MSPATRLGLNNAFWFAFWRFVSVLGAGLVALAGYVTFVTFGPAVEGTLWPVTSNYTMTNIRAEPNGGLSFEAKFYKGRECTYYGVTWFAADTHGNLGKIQVAPLGREPQAPATGPTGWRITGRQILFPPEGTTAIQAVQNHDCGFVWQTRTTLGPFPLGPDGLPIVEPGVPAAGNDQAGG